MAKWAAFWALGLIWGSSFLLISVAVKELTPFQVVFIRTGIAAIGMNFVLLLRGTHLPFTLRDLLPLIVIGIGNTSLPFALISWGETSIPSSLAGVLQSTAVFFTMIVAHFAMRDERITAQKIAGMTIGFIGVSILATRSVAEDGQITPAFLGALAVVGASICYAVFTVYSRQQIKDRYAPIMVSAGAMTFAAISSGIAILVSPLVGGETPTDLATLSRDAVGAVLLLGALNTFIAYLMYYWMVRELGAARSSMVTYIVPAVSVFLGALILHEPIDARLLFGTALIFTGIAVVNLKLFARLNGVFRPAQRMSIM
ncbi:MAG: EamA family transporter [Anaerolineae bacterium]|nr:EamA family transporter [Anaerolineae bacterium]NUQ06777.1 EamA family transporter [Anaerolineae bacterium]